MYKKSKYCEDDYGCADVNIACLWSRNSSSESHSLSTRGFNTAGKEGESAIEKTRTVAPALFVFIDTFPLRRSLVHRYKKRRAVKLRDCLT